MQFSDLKAGDALYVYDRSAIALTISKVVSVSAPRIDKTNIAAGMVVDVVVDNTTYTFKDASDVGFTGNLIISPEKSTILREVEGQKTNNEAQIARVDTLKSELPKLETIIDQLSPEKREKKAQEERLTRLEDSIGSLKEMMELVLKQKKDGSK